MGTQRNPGEAPAGQVHHIRPVALANATAAVAAAAYLICLALSVFALGFLIALFSPWFHNVRADVIQPGVGQFQPAELFFGLVTFTAAAWVAAGTVGRLYNLWAGNPER
ncbi:MAG: DUF5676 family membrane protein [Chloroflexota bacterium]